MVEAKTDWQGSYIKRPGVDYYQICLTGDCYEIADDSYLTFDMQMMNVLFDRGFHLKYASSC